MESVPDIPTGDDSRPKCERCLRPRAGSAADWRKCPDLCGYTFNYERFECDRLLLERAKRAEGEAVSLAVELGVVKGQRRALRVAGNALAAVAHLFLDGECETDALRRGVEAWRDLPRDVR